MDANTTSAHQSNPPESFTFQSWPVYRAALKVNRLLADSWSIRARIGRRDLLDQLDRAAASIPLNLAEGYSRVTKKEKQAFLRIAQGSAYECVAVIDLLRELGAIDPSTYRPIFDLLHEIARMTGGLINHIEKHEGRWRKRTETER